MGCLLAWADSRTTERPGSGGMGRGGSTCLITCLSPSWGVVPMHVQGEGRSESYLAGPGDSESQINQQTRRLTVTGTSRRQGVKGSFNSAIGRHVMLTVTWGPHDNGSPNLIRQIRAATAAEATPGAKEQ